MLNTDVTFKIICKKRNDRVISVTVNDVKTEPEEYIFPLSGDIYDGNGGMFGFNNSKNVSNNWKFLGKLKTLKLIDQAKIDDLNNKLSDKRYTNR